jgi:integrase
MSGKKNFVQPPRFSIYSPEDLTKNWYVEWYEGTKRKRRYGTINRLPTYAQRMQAAKQLIQQLQLQHTRRTTIAEEAVFKFLAKNKPYWRKKTIEQYKTTATTFFDFAKGENPTPALVESFMDWIRSTRNPTTYNKYHSQLNRFLTEAGYPNLFMNIARVKANPMPARYFQTFQRRRLASYISENDEELWLFIKFVFYCFIRPGEACMLKVEDLLLDDGEIRVPGEKSKNHKTQYVAIPDSFRPDLEQLVYSAPNQWLFPSSQNKGHHVHRNTMYHRHKIILKELGFGKGYSLYSWKHTGAVAAVKAGISIKELQIQLRHHSLDETDKYLRQMGIKDVHQLRRHFPSITQKGAA